MTYNIKFDLVYQEDERTKRVEHKEEVVMLARHHGFAQLFIHNKYTIKGKREVIIRGVEPIFQSTDFQGMNDIN